MPPTPFPSGPPSRDGLYNPADVNDPLREFYKRPAVDDEAAAAFLRKLRTINDPTSKLSLLAQEKDIFKGEWRDPYLRELIELVFGIKWDGKHNHVVSERHRDIALAHIYVMRGMYDILYRHQPLAPATLNIIRRDFADLINYSTEHMFSPLLEKEQIDYRLHLLLLFEVITTAIPQISGDGAHDFLGTLRVDSLLNLVHCAFFGVSRQLYDRIGISMPNALDRMFSAIGNKNGNRFPQGNAAAHYALSLYGPEVITRRIVELFEDTKLAERYPLLAVTLLLHVLYVDQLYTTFVRFGLHTALIRRAWELFGEGFAQPCISSHINVIGCIVGNLLYQLDEKVLATQVMIHDLVCESQYVLLLGNSLSVYKEAIPNELPNLLHNTGDRVAELTAGSPWVHSFMYEEWLHIYQSLNVLLRCSDANLEASGEDPRYQLRLDVWCRFGKLLGYSIPPKLPPAPVLQSDQKGCSWFKCCFHDEAETVCDMLRCSCRKVQYCSSRCQKRHWDHDHRHKCAWPSLSSERTKS